MSKKSPAIFIDSLLASRYFNNPHSEAIDSEIRQRYNIPPNSFYSIGVYPSTNYCRLYIHDKPENTTPKNLINYYPMVNKPAIKEEENPLQQSGNEVKSLKQFNCYYALPVIKPEEMTENERKFERIRL